MKNNQSILKRKNNLQPQKSKKVEEAPVVQKKIIKKQEKSSYSKFLKVFKQKKQNDIEYQVNNSKYLKIEFMNKQNYNSYENHFNQNIENINRNIIEVENQKKKDIDEKIQSILDIENVKNETKVLNNNIDIKQFKLNNQLKQVKYSKTENLPQLMVNQLFINSYKQNKISKIFQMNQKSSVQTNLQKNPLNAEESDIFRFINEYIDFTYIDPENKQRDSFVRMMIFHILNHLSQIDQKKKQHGYTKCKILVITDNKQSACDIVDNLCTFYTNGKENRIQNAQKFEEEYGDVSKGLEDNFKIGISFNQNIVKLYESFTNSDIIIASPLALKLLFTQQNHLAFLSSIEILIIDNANKIYMQNWTHIQEIMLQINNMPKHQDVFYDFELIRDYFFENKQKFFRQSIIYSEFNFAELNQLKFDQFLNYKGNVEIKPYYQQELKHLDIAIEYMKIELDQYVQDIDVRFEYFLNKIWQKIYDDPNINQTAIVTSSYIEFVKLRNYFKKTNAFVQYISEYTKKSKAQSKIAQVMNQQTPFLLINERAYYYDVCKLKNMKNIIFYSPPKNTFIFKQMIEKMYSENNDGPNLHNRIACIFSNYDQIYLEKLVGSKQSQEFFQNYNKSTTFII